MKCGLILICLTVVAAGGFQSILWSKEGPEKKPIKESGIDGVWSELCRENGGKLVSSRPQINPNPKPTDAKAPRLWKISKTKIEKGPDDDTFPSEQWSIELHPGNKLGTIDGVLLDKDGKKSAEHKWQAIYQLKDDYLLVCLSLDKARPERFTTSGASNGTFLFLLRRGRHK